MQWIRVLCVVMMGIGGAEASRAMHSTLDALGTYVSRIRVPRVVLPEDVRGFGTFVRRLSVRHPFDPMRVSRPCVGALRCVHTVPLDEDAFGAVHGAPPAYADATVDVAFKEMMWKTDNDPVALSFIQTFVPDIQVESVEFLNSAPLAIPVLKARGEKQIFMDFYVKTKEKHHYLVELQSQKYMRFDKTALFYACSVYSGPLEENHFNDPDWDIPLRSVIVIQVVDYDTNRIRGIRAKEGGGVDPNDQDFVDRVGQLPLPDGQAEKHFMMTDQHSGQRIEHLQMIQIELPRYEVGKMPQAGETPSDKDWWIRVLRYSDEYTVEEINQMRGIPAFVREAMDRLSFSKWDPVMVQEYKESVIDRGKYSTVLQVERAEGKAEGIVEGRSQRDIQLAKGWAHKGKSMEQIAEDLERSVDWVKAALATSDAGMSEKW